MLSSFFLLDLDGLVYRLQIKLHSSELHEVMSGYYKLVETISKLKFTSKQILRQSNNRTDIN